MTTELLEKVSAPPNAGESEQLQAGQKILQALFGAVKAAMVYAANNQAYRARAGQLHSLLQEYHSRHGSLRIDFFNDFFFIDNQRLKYGGAVFSHGRELRNLFEKLHWGRLEFAAAPDAELLDRAIFAVAGVDRRAEDPFGALQAAWAELSTEQMSIGRIQPKTAHRLPSENEIVDTANHRRRRAGRLFFRTTGLMREFTQRLHQTGTAEARVKRAVHNLVDHIIKDEASLLEFATIKNFDDYTYAHSTNVSLYAIAIGLRLGLERRRLSQLGFAALFHDVGKVKLAAELIQKPDEFTEDDWEQMHRHPILGVLTLAALPNTDEHHARSILVAYEHHMTMDGKGYPVPPTARLPNLFSRIVAIADSYDAMTSGRVYIKNSLSPDVALQRMVAQSGIRYDPVLLRALIHVLGIFPIGTFVRLSTGELAAVKYNDAKDLYRPQVRLLREGEAAEGPDEIIDLTATDEQTGEYLAFITETISPDLVEFSVAEALGLDTVVNESLAEATGI